jgi:anti-sigma regulatory factor (Ser/Thr protein kinase)
VTVAVVTIGIPSEAVDVAAVRGLAGQIGAILGVAVDGGYVQLLTTELVSNAVRVGAGAVTTSFSRSGDAVRVEVHDNGGGWPVMGRPQPLDENGGRGLLIVDALADAWGAEADPDRGTTVWFELRSDGDRTRALTPVGAREGRKGVSSARQGPRSSNR